MSACSTTKNLPAGEKLYLGINEIKIDGNCKMPAGVNATDEAQAALEYAPNNSILGSSTMRFPFPFGLWIYNDFVKYEDKKGLGNWIFKKMAAKPVFLSAVNPSTRAKIASNILKEYGFFNGRVDYSLKQNKNPKKVKVNYTINTSNPYLIDSVAYINFPKDADSLIRASIRQTKLIKGRVFSIVNLEEERQRLSDLFRDKGYFYFRPDFITYKADTIQNPGYVSLRVMPKQGLPEIVGKKFYIGKMSIYLSKTDDEKLTDSVKYRDVEFFYKGKHPGIKEQVYRKRLFFKDGSLYSQKAEKFSNLALSRLGVFRLTEFRYTPRNNGYLNDTLDLNIYNTFDLPYDAELEFNVTNKSTDQAGPGAIFNLTRRNFLRTGAKLNFQLKGSYEWQTNSVGVNERSTMNSYELGTSLSLSYPRLLIPFVKNDIDKYKFPANTTFKIYADQLNRAKFFKMLSFGGNLTYDFQPQRVWKHIVSPFELTFNTRQKTTARFDSVIANNKSLALSLGNQFIPAMRYTVLYDNTILKKRNLLWWESSVTSAGNLTSLIYAGFGEKLDKKDKKLMNTPFAQFLKFTSEIRNLFKVGRRRYIATRLMGGVIFSYGNQSVAPYNEQFYIGGANSVRAFTIRSIGPGSFHPNPENRYGYLDETGDIKLELNVEYRFPLIADLYGATFIDSGNVWLLKKDSERPGGELTVKNFANTIALGTGVGLRYDLTYLVLRLDLGIGIHAPYDTGKRGYYNMTSFKDSLGLHFGIGYPF